jgi:hypothetical protein
MIAQVGTPTARESCDQATHFSMIVQGALNMIAQGALNMIVQGGTPTARESCDQAKGL